MLEWFLCPDNFTIPIKECLVCTTKCRLGNVCLTQPTRKEIAKERVQNIIWKCPNCKKEIKYGIG